MRIQIAYIFTKADLEAYGRIGIGAIELISELLLVYRKTAWLGATVTLGVIGGAIMMHLTQLG